MRAFVLSLSNLLVAINDRLLLKEKILDFFPRNSPILVHLFMEELRRVNMTHHLELLSQSNHRLFSVGHELLQVLIPQLLASTAFPRALPASFCNGIAKENEGEKTIHINTRNRYLQSAARSSRRKFQPRIRAEHKFLWFSASGCDVTAS